MPNLRKSLRGISRKTRPRFGETLEPRCMLAADVVINEIHYDPPNKTEFSEFVELYNNSDDAIDLSGWAFTDGIRYEFPTGAAIAARSYLVVAQDPGTTQQVFGVDSLGPWDGQLKNSGEQIQLRDESGVLIDQVDYGRGFPWPNVGDRPGHSIELISPDLDNDLGGNWRRAGAVGEVGDSALVSRGLEWSYFPGTEAPADGWNETDFDDAAWQTGMTPIGFGDNHVETPLNDMRGNYSTVYLRHEFEVTNPSAIPSLNFGAQFDDGVNMWINGQHMVSANVTGSNLPHTGTAGSALENFEFQQYELPSPSTFLVEGTNVIAVQMANASLGGSSDAWFDGELSIGATGNFTPGSSNTVVGFNSPPASRQVNHVDALGNKEVASGEDVVVTTKVTDPDGVAAVSLEYQVVQPGDWFGRYLKAEQSGEPRLDPRYDDPAEWTTISMNDAGTAGDSEADDDVFSVTVPASVQQHRHLVRYRINVEDTLGASVTVPYADDPNHNFAYFVYDGVPDWTGRVSSSRAEQTYELSQFNDIATYHLLTTEDAHHESQHVRTTTQSSGYRGSEYLWQGTMVYDGEVYDHIRYRARGGTWRYSMGKNMWKFDFNRGASFQAKDNYGNEYQESWDKLNFSAVIQQGDYLHRGEQGLFESVGFKLFNLAGVESPNTHYVQFRVVDSEDENGADQYSGDFQGLYLAIEQLDGNFLDQHDLPDGNLYKIDSYTGDSNNQGPTQVTDASDVAAFISNVEGRNASDSWWRENFDLERYYSYRTVVFGIHHYDISEGKNYFYYNNPETEKFQVVPWDLDLTWADNMYGSGEHSLTQIIRNDVFEIEYDNRVRELLDLLYNEEQTGMLIDEYASMVSTPGELSWVDVDRAMWDFNPIMSSRFVNDRKSGLGRFYGRSGGTFQGMTDLMKEYVNSRGRLLERAADRSAPEPQTPTVTYTGTENFPTNGLGFTASAFEGEGESSFAAMEWRIAEITDPLNPNFGDAPPMYEINATYESGELSAFDSNWTIPSDITSEGSLYRVRVRMKSDAGHWSHWSDPVQFTAGSGEPTSTADALRITEVHFNPADPSKAEIDAGFDDADDFEFIEIVNTGTESISLEATSFRKIDVDGDEEGVAFEFEAGQQLGPGEHLLVVESIEAFQLRYGDQLPVAGEWSGKLGNGGESISLVDDGVVIHEFAYDDAWHPTTDGEGYSLELLDPTSDDLDSWATAAAWAPSNDAGGSPGTSRVTVELVDLLADFNGDNAVNFADFLILSGQFGSQTATFETGDADGDGTVAFSDFLVLSANFGRTRD